MQILEIAVYSASELKEKFPNAFDRAVTRWNGGGEIFWQSEIIASLKALFKSAGVKLADWSLGAYNQGNFVTASFTEDACEDLSGGRAMAWLENNLFGPLRIRGNSRVDDWRQHIDPATGYLRRNAPLDTGARFYRTGDGALHKRGGHVGEIPSCPFTGYCADEDYLDALRLSVRSGDTLKEAFQGLADTCQTLLELESEDQSSPEYFLRHADANGMRFTEDGNEF